MNTRKKVIRLKMTPKGREYGIEKDKHKTLSNLYSYAKENMTSPYMYHLLSHVSDEEAFRKSKSNLIRLFQRQLKAQYKPLEQACPDVLIAYSIEFKYTKQKEIDGDSDCYAFDYKDNYINLDNNNNELLPFLHIHFYVIADCKKARPHSFPKFAIDSLNTIDGLRAARYLRDMNNNIYKPIKKSDDALLRFLYIGKVEQKSDKIPYKKTFGTSKIEVAKTKIF